MTFPSSRPTSKIKDQILLRLKLDGAQTATMLAEQLALSPMAIRQHLQTLLADQWVTYQEEKQPVGRPVKFWRLTDRTQSLFPNHHGELAVSLLQSAARLFGEIGVENLLHHRASQQLQRYQAAMTNCATWRDRLSVLAELRSQEGYMADIIEQSDNTVLLVENHCSICAAAQECPMLCHSELEVFSALLEPELSLQRVEHILAGDRRCAYLITPQDPNYAHDPEAP